eukprot:UN09123
MKDFNPKFRNMMRTLDRHPDTNLSLLIRSSGLLATIASSTVNDLVNKSFKYSLVSTTTTVQATKKKKKLRPVCPDGADCKVTDGNHQNKFYHKRKNQSKAAKDKPSGSS